MSLPQPALMNHDQQQSYTEWKVYSLPLLFARDDNQHEQLVALTSVNFSYFTIVQAMIPICRHQDPSGCDAFEGFRHVSQPAWILRSARDFDEMN